MFLVGVMDAIMIMMMKKEEEEEVEKGMLRLSLSNWLETDQA